MPGMVLGQSFNGAGDTWTPTIINLFVFWLWEIPLAYVLGVVMGFGPYGVFLMTMNINLSALQCDIDDVNGRRGSCRGEEQRAKGQKSKRFLPFALRALLFALSPNTLSHFVTR